MRPKISVIVPVYKVENYLRECIESIQAQTYENLEILLVDDGSPDRCGEICEEYAKKDERILALHKENGGLSDARNYGIARATGKYFIFVDSDDYIKENMIEALYQGVEKYDAQIAVSGFMQVSEDGQPGEIFLDGTEEKVLSKTETQKRYFENYACSMIYTVAWNKIYAAELFQKHSYRKGKLHEDEFLTYRLLYAAKKVVYIPEVLNCYRCREQSIMDNFNERRFHLFEAYLEKAEFYKHMKNSELWALIAVKILHMFPQYQSWAEKANKPELKRVVAAYRKKIGRVLTKKGVKKSKKLQAEIILFTAGYPLYYIMWKMKKH